MQSWGNISTFTKHPAWDPRLIPSTALLTAMFYSLFAVRDTFHDGCFDHGIMTLNKLHKSQLFWTLWSISCMQLSTCNQSNLPLTCIILQEIQQNNCHQVYLKFLVTKCEWVFSRCLHKKRETCPILFILNCNNTIIIQCNDTFYCVRN